jgi:hypothetical protein
MNPDRVTYKCRLSSPQTAAKPSCRLAPICHVGLELLPGVVGAASELTLGRTSGGWVGWHLEQVAQRIQTASGRLVSGIGHGPGPGCRKGWCSTPLEHLSPRVLVRGRPTSCDTVRVAQVVHFPYAVEQDEDGVWCATALLRPGVGAVGDGARPEESVTDLRAALQALVEVVGPPPANRL